MVIKVEHYTKKIKGICVLSDVNLEFESGIIYGLSGPNGSGKTMLMRAVAGLIHPTRGSVSVDGKMLGGKQAFPDSIGMLLENPAFIGNYTGMENLQVIASIKKKITKEDIRNVLVNVGLSPTDKRTYKKYSLGMKQKLGIAAALMEEPDILLLDEPFNALDTRTVEKVKELILGEKERGACILLACHNKQDMTELCDHIIEIEEGKVVSNRG